MKKLLLSTTALLAMTAMAAAADLPARTMAPAPAPILAAPVFTWTGFYAGVHGGYITNEGRARLTDTSFFGGSVDAAVAGGLLPRRLNADSDGFMFGGQIGGNVQFGAFVAGIEADISYVDIGGSASFNSGAPDFLVTTVRNDMEFFGTVRGRLGLAFDRVMIYGTGGLAYGDANSRLTGEFAGTPAGFIGNLYGPGSDDDIQIGYTVGGGVEFAITNNLTIKGEYLYYNLGDQTLTASRPESLTGGGAIRPARQITYNVENEGHIGRVGINFKF